MEQTNNLQLKMAFKCVNMFPEKAIRINVLPTIQPLEFLTFSSLVHVWVYI